MAELQSEVRRAFTELFDQNKEVERVYKKVVNGSASYEEAQNFASEVGKILSTVLTGKISNVDELALEVVDEMVSKGTRIVSAVCKGVQENLNEAAGVGLNPIEPNPIGLDKRRRDLIDSMSKSEEPLGLIGDKQTSSFLMAEVDEFVKSNADFQARAGMEPIIVRKWDGTYGSHDTKHTDWCSKLQGVWEYGTEPADVYKRHKGCQCTVAYYPNKKAQGYITALAKGEKDTEEVLWNTGREFSQSRKAVLARRRKKYGKEEARRILNEEWKGGLNGQAERHFT